MELYVFDTYETGASKCVGMIDSYKSFRFTKNFQKSGTFQLRGNYTEATSDLLKAGRLLWATPTLCGLIHTVNWSIDDDGAVSYVAYGKDLKDILSYRIVWDTYDHSLPTNKWIDGVIQENTKDGRDLFAVYSTPDIKCPTYSKQVSYKNLKDVVEDACEAQLTTSGLLLGYDVWQYPGGDGFYFGLKEGADRSYGSPDPVLISRYVDNVTTLDYAYSNADLINTVLVGGQEQGSSRVRYSATTDGKDYRGIYRREAFADARNLQQTYKDANGNDQTLSDDEYKNVLLQEAQEHLAPETVSIDAETVMTSAKGLELLGAKVTLLDTRLGLKADDFITSVDIIDEASDTLTTLTVGKGVDARPLIIKGA